MTKPEMVRLGSLYMNGQPVESGTVYNDESLSFGNTRPGYELQWVDDGGMLVADRCVCSNISWTQLDKIDFVLGTPVRIDGKAYICRCLKVGDEENTPNEWDSLMNKYGVEDRLWHWDRCYFWGQETSKYDASRRAVRGSRSARCWDDYYATSQRMYVGFRPVLEPLDFEPCSPDALVGKTVKAYCSDDVIIEGHLVDCSDYDIVLRASSPLPVNCPWAVKQNRSVIVNRENINWLKETQIAN